MLPKTHILIGAIISFILYLIFNLTLFQTGIIFLSSFLIDIDHYFWYALELKTFSLKKHYKYALRKTKVWRNLKNKHKRVYKFPIFIFHGIDFFIILLVLSFFYRFLLFVLIGVIIHMFFDYFDILYHKDPIYIKLSPSYLIVENKTKKTHLKELVEKLS